MQVSCPLFWLAALKLLYPENEPRFVFYPRGTGILRMPKAWYPPGCTKPWTGSSAASGLI